MRTCYKDIVWGRHTGGCLILKDKRITFHFEDRQEVPDNTEQQDKEIPPLFGKIRIPWSSLAKHSINKKSNASRPCLKLILKDDHVYKFYIDTREHLEDIKRDIQQHLSLMEISDVTADARDQQENCNHKVEKHTDSPMAVKAPLLPPAPPRLQRKLPPPLVIEKDKQSKRAARQARRQQRQGVGAIAARTTDDITTPRPQHRGTFPTTTSGPIAIASNPTILRGLAKNNPARGSTVGVTIQNIVPLRGLAKNRILDHQSRVEAPGSSMQRPTAEDEIEASPDEGNVSLLLHPESPPNLANGNDEHANEQSRSSSVDDSTFGEEDEDNPRNEYLVEAMLVSDAQDTEQEEGASTNIIEARPVETKEIVFNFLRTRTGYALLACVCLVVAGVIVAITLISLDGGNTDPEVFFEKRAENTTASPTVAPTPISQSEDAATLLLELNTTNSTRARVANDDKGTTPPSRAIAWLVQDPYIQSLSKRQKLQRFILATLFFATGGEELWIQTDNWLGSRSNECSWWMAQGYYPCANMDDIITLLSLKHNGLNGTLPPEVALLSPSLWKLDFAENDLYGTIPTEWGTIKELKHLNISHNHLTISSEMPTTDGALGLYQSLEELDLSFNNMSGPFPTLFGSLRKLQELLLHSNKISGSIPAGLPSTLSHLDVGANLLEGQLPTELGLLKSLCILDVSKNSLTTAIPTELGHLCSGMEIDAERPLPQLRALRLSQNKLFGSIPTELLGRASLWQQLDLGANSITGTLPTQLWLASELQMLNISDNLISGAIPSEVWMASALSVLDISWNRIRGTLPSELGLLQTLCEMDISNNSITGPIPSELGRLCWLHSDELVLPFFLQFGFFEGTNVRLFSEEELAGLIDQTELFYADLLEFEYPSFQYLNISWVTSILEPGADLPVSLDLLASIVFIPGVPPPSRAEVSTVLWSANYMSFILDYIWFAESFGTSLWFDVQEVRFEEHADMVEEVKVPEIARLDLSYNKLSGTIPSELAALFLAFPQHSLELLGNNFQGSLPYELCPPFCDGLYYRGNGTAYARGLRVDCAQVLCLCNCAASASETAANYTINATENVTENSGGANEATVATEATENVTLLNQHSNIFAP